MDSFVIQSDDVVSVEVVEDAVVSVGVDPAVPVQVLLIGGPQGIQGQVGPIGLTGNTGAAASVAVGTVSTGEPGSQAVVTNAGTSASAVLNFTIPRGAVGATGATGAQGVAGSPGAAGSVGERGLQGIPGEIGPAGPVGPTGAAGSQGVPGIQGERGLQGIPGERGERGLQGIQGIQGERGDRGETGATGPAGATGSQGAAGVSLDIQGSVATYSALPANAQPGDAWIVLSDGKLYYRDATGFPPNGQGVPFQGPQGIQGVPGERGLTGETGSVGPAGPSGATGASGERGLQGIPGERGLQGIPGEIGPAGPAGATGAAGSQGIPGIQGPKGDAGRGFTWRGAFSGANTYAVDDVISFAGGSYLCLTAGTTQDPTAAPSAWSMLAAKGETGAVGATGAAGAVGETGATGPAGTTTWSGLSGVPADIVYASSSQTLTSKRITPRVASVASSGTPAINTDTTDLFVITALAENITSMTTGLTGTPTDGQKLLIRIKGAAAQTIAWGVSFISSGVATLPTTTVAGRTHTVGLIWDAAVQDWVCVAVDGIGY